MLGNLRKRLMAFLAAAVLGAGSFVSVPVVAPVAAVAVVTSISLLAPQQAQAAALSNYTQNHFIDGFFRAQSWTLPATIYIALDTSAGSAAACGTEVSGGAYARVAVTSALANWAGTQSAGSTTTSTGTSGQTSNNAAITFPAPTANWGTVVGFCAMDASSAGNLLFYAALTTSKSVNNGDAAPSFAAAALTYTIAHWMHAHHVQFANLGPAANDSLFFVREVADRRRAA